ncbi:MAG TPA: hypothetical protein V6C63_06810 [Allocoleopsis sp.]
MAKFKCDKCGKEVELNSNLSGKPHMVNCPDKGRWVEVAETDITGEQGNG